MIIFWRRKMADYRNDKDNRDSRDNRDYRNDYGYTHDCECCHCKKIFMMLVLLILVFMAGIMVGNCGRCRYADNYYANNWMHKYNQIKPKKFHKGMHEINPNMVKNNPQSVPNEQMGGFIVEIDQSN
jgi:hypothetical protein